MGQVAGIRLDGVDHYVWWGASERSTDGVFVDEDARVVSFPSADACAAWADGLGLPTFSDDESVDDRVDDTADYPSLLDCDALRPWLDRKTTALDPTLALDVLNMSIDFAESLGRTWSPAGADRDHSVYEKLFGASVPWSFGLESYVPTWSVHELGVLRDALTRAVGLLRLGLGTA
ncbi:hypothetical protein GCM10025780_09030 [Frondihabitans cladoniiphilus]|uniref:Uncharacterized protein n=2 Tax=Frondihabitans cladoniiphilus TaxID=715785 RepID=A0ABP8VRU9_9MICO